jgi:membrane associated rhomboid family serine protease
MFPIGDDNSGRTRTPHVTWALIALNVLVFIYEVTMGPALERFIFTWGSIPRETIHGQDLHTLITSMFLHGGFMHLIGNMLFLKVFGDNVEDQFGPGRFLFFYLLNGLMAHAAHIALNPGSNVPTVGASGAISGVLGAYIVMFRSNRVRVFFGYGIIDVPAWMMIGFWALQQFLSTWASFNIRTDETTGVAYAAHAGGFLGGVALAFVMRPRRRVGEWVRG